MNRRFFGNCLLWSGAWCCIPAMGPSVVCSQDQGYSQLRGLWQVIELVDDGRVIPTDAIATWIPSGGQIEVIDNTFVFTSSIDGQRHARTFELDATRYPCEINIREKERLYGQGIYRLDGERLVLCVAPPEDGARPVDFSAPERSRRVLMVLKRSNAVPVSVEKSSPTTARKLPPALSDQSKPAPPLVNLPPPPDLRAPSGSSGKFLTDAEVARMLRGTWKYTDKYGALYLTMDSNGTYSTFRETPATSAFQQVFARAPVSSGTWVLNNGQATFQVTSSVQRERINQKVPFILRSISETDLIFVDYLGQVGKAVKVR